MRLVLFMFIWGINVTLASAEARLSADAAEQITSATHHGEAKETPPETFAVLDLFSEALEASVAGVWVKFTELRPKVIEIQHLYKSGEKDKAFAKALGVSTEVVMLGFFIETFGVGEMFINALSFSGDWMLQLAQSVGGIMVSTKAASHIAEKIEEAAEEKYRHAATRKVH